MKTNRFLSVFLAIVIMIMSLNVLCFAGNEIMIPGTDAATIVEDSTGRFECCLSGDDTVRIEKYLKNEENVEIPSEIAGYKVSDIGYEAFKDNKKIKSVTVSDTVTSISASAFESCENLVNINLPESIISIGENAFYNTGYCNDKKNWDGKLLYINNYLIMADSEISGKQIVKENTTVIAASCFKECGSLTEVVLPDSLLVIENAAFYNCVSLKKVNLPENLKIIEVSAFEQCAIENISIPASVNSVSYNSFASCESLKDIKIADDVVNISKEAFYNTSFYNDKSNWENGVLYIDKHLIYADETEVSGDYVVKSVTKTISDDAFDNCDKLTNVTVNDGIKTIGGWTFANCDKLESVSLPDSVVTIGYSAFRDSDSLESIVIPNGVTVIETEAFYHCDNLKKVTISENILEIGYGAFGACNESLTIHGYTNSAAEDYANENDVKFVSLGVKQVAGDTNNDGGVSATDARLVLQAVAGINELSAEAKEVADVNGDGDVTAVDARYILQIVAGLR